jgi:hypothetical protein
MRPYFKLIPVLLLLTAVIYFYTIFNKGIRSGWQEISQIMTLRDIRLIMNAIQQEYITYRRFPEQQELKDFINKKVVLKDRIFGPKEPWKDVWGTPFRFNYNEEGKIIFQSAGLDRVFSEYDPFSEEVMNNPALLGDDISYFTNLETILENKIQNQPDYNQDTLVPPE